MEKPSADNRKLRLRKAKGPQRPEPNVEAYCRRIGIGGERPFGSFWKSLVQRFGPAGKQAREAIEARNCGEAVDIYTAKNSSLDLSLAIASQFCGDLYRKYLSWFARERYPSPSTILDIGCESGILTCFYAMMYPTAHVFGLDHCPAAIQCAAELALKLNLTNVSFENSDIRTCSERKVHAFDLVTATLVFREAVPFPDFETPSFSNVMPAPDAPICPSDILVKLLRPGAVLISVERCASLRDFSWWARVLNGAVSLVWDRSHLLRFRFDKQSELVPIIVGQKNKTLVHVTDEDILAFRSYDELEDKAEQLEFEGHSAEAFFYALNPKQFVGGVQSEYHNGSGTERFELWIAGPFVITYIYTNRGFRRLCLRSKAVAGEMLPLLDFNRRENSRFATVETYASPITGHE